MIQKDKNGQNLNVGDWVLYPWKRRDRSGCDYFCGKIKELGGIKSPNTIFVRPNIDRKNGASTASYTEKLPADKKERKNVMFLRKLEMS